MIIMNTVADILAALKALAHDPLFARIEILDLTRHVIKARLHVREDLFVQVYRNDASQVTNFLLILERQRIFARDEIRGLWHRHPFDEPEIHDTSAEGQRPVLFPEFVEEVRELLVKTELL